MESQPGFASILEKARKHFSPLKILQRRPGSDPPTAPPTPNLRKAASDRLDYPETSTFQWS
jgi:hypothetical protein